MNTPMITIKQLSSLTNTLVLEFAAKFYGRELTKKESDAFVSMELEDKEWLIKQYKEEVKYNTIPDFNTL
jgi:hypothetical protein